MEVRRRGSWAVGGWCVGRSRTRWHTHLSAWRRRRRTAHVFFRRQDVRTTDGRAQRRFAQDDWRQATETEKTQAWTSYFGYFGTYTIDEKKTRSNTISKVVGFQISLGPRKNGTISSRENNWYSMRRRRGARYTLFGESLRKRSWLLSKKMEARSPIRLRRPIMHSSMRTTASAMIEGGILGWEHPLIFGWLGRVLGRRDKFHPR